MPANLRLLQEQFIASLHGGISQALTVLIPALGTRTTDQQIKVYQDSVAGKLHKALQDIYPVCEQLVGDLFFNAMSAAYIRLTPSHSQDLNLYGATLADFIQSFAPADSLPYLSDIARLEWAWHQITNAPDDEFDFARLNDCLHEESLHFILPQCSTVLASPYPLLRIWEVNQKNFSAENTVVLNPAEHYFFFVWQQHYVLHIDPLTQEEWQILCWVQSGMPLTLLAQHIADHFPAITIPDLLSAWVQRGWIASFAL